jgi:enamine deaminase RidA (YjgF/YER057c/UK114 family)
MPDHRRILVSGTASIAPEGHTVHVGDTRAQIGKTLEVVEAILESRRMQWSDVVRGIAYMRNAADVPLYRRYCAGHGLPPMPAVVMNSVICRDDLLFELEVDAVRR